MLIGLKARFKKMLNMQVVVYESTLRLDRIPQDRRDRTFHHRAGLLSEKERPIEQQAQQALKLLLEEGTSIAMPEAIREMIEDMQAVRSFLSRGKTGELPQVIEEDVISALEEMIEPVKKAHKA